MLAIYGSGSEGAEVAIKRLRSAGATRSEIVLPSGPGFTESPAPFSRGRDFGRLLIPGERLLIVPAGRLATREIIEILGQDTMPAVFVLPTVWKTDEERTPTLTGPPPGTADNRGLFTAKPSLPGLLTEVARTLAISRSGLMLSNRLGHSLTAASAWLLDNPHVFEGHLAEVRANLPKHYPRILPALLHQPDQLRIYRVAVDTVRETGGILTQEKLVAGLTAYQHRHPLDIAELWAFPLMLRVAVLEELARRATAVSHDQDLREAAYLWGNRLVAGGRAGLSDRKSTRLNSSHGKLSRMPSSA